MITKHEVKASVAEGKKSLQPFSQQKVKMKKKLIPFRWMPASYGLYGRPYEEAEAAYYYEGEELDRILAKIRYQDADALKKENIRLDIQYGKLVGYDAELALLNEDDLLGKLSLDLRYNRITEKQFNKAKATLENEPWIDIISSGFNKNEGLSGLEFEFDWNDRWIAFLRENGYTGSSDEEVVQQWFNTVSRATFDDYIDLPLASIR